MSNRSSRAVAIAACWIALASYPAVARAQSALEGFDPGANNPVYALAVQPDGKILVGGDFTTLGGGGTGTTPRNYIGRLNADGSVDATFNPGANARVHALVVQPDGKILVGGNFTTLGGGGPGATTRNRLGRLNADGSVDSTFDPGANGSVSALTVQPDGKILAGGNFTMLGGGGTGTTARNNLGRLNANGALDTSFNPGATRDVYAVAVQLDGKILVGGAFTMLGGGGTGTTTRNHIGRLNADGSLDTSFNPGANNDVFALAVQPDRKILVGGNFTTLGGGGPGTTTRNRLGRLNADGSLDPSFDPGVNGSVRALAVQPDGKILVGGQFTTLGGGGTTVRNDLGRLNADGSLDSSFNPGANAQVRVLAVQPDGKIVVGGDFTILGGGGTGTTARNRIGRVYADGSLDRNFDPGANNTVAALAVQPDGKILVGGQFTTLGGGGTTARSRIGRLHADGSVDTSFDPGANAQVRGLQVQPDGKIVVVGDFVTLGGGGPGTTGRNRIGRLNADGSIDPGFNPGADGTVYALALQPDGKILVGGGFGRLGGPLQYNLGRLEADGSLDTSFGTGTNGGVFALAVQPDGRIVVAGSFRVLVRGGIETPREMIGRLNADGSLDATFNPGANATINAVAVQADGKILVGGAFTTLGGGGFGTTARNGIGRLNADGSLDTSFNPGAAGVNSQVYTLAVQTDGKILVGGNFTTLGGATRNHLGRLNPDGSLDTTFDPGANSTSTGGVFDLALQPDGKILVGGNFTMLGGGGTGTTPRSSLGRLTNTDAAIQSLGVTGGATITITWSRSGAGPEVWRTTFESTTDGATYTSLGNSARIPGGWQVSGQSLAVNQNYFIRARGYYQTGLGGSGSIVESVRAVYISSPPPTVVTGAATGITGTTATLNGTANANGSATTGQFAYGLTAAYGATTPVQQLGAGNATLAIGGGSVTGLTCGTLYHFRAQATNSFGLTTGSDETFTTQTCLNTAPTITAIAAQTIDEDTVTGALAFTVGDVETAAASLTLTGSSSNTTLVPTANIVFGGSGASRTVAVTPALNQFGSATITVTVSDGSLSTPTSFLLTVSAVNDAPTITAIAAQTIDEDTVTGALAFTVGDVETAAASLTLSGGSSNPTLVPNANIVFSGSGANRTVAVTPALNQFGTATITVTVSDGSLSTPASFLLTVSAVNRAPTITAIAAQTIDEDTVTGALAFTVGDVETAAASLTLSGGSSNPTLVPNANIVFGGSGASRTVTVTPALDQSGTATITVTVSDGSLSTLTSFLLTVSAVNDAPTITAIAAQTINLDTTTGPLAFTVGDVETGAASLTLSGGSSNPRLVPNANIVFSGTGTSGSGASRTVTVIPAVGESGTTTITVTVSDGGQSAATAFVVTVNPQPTIGLDKTSLIFTATSNGSAFTSQTSAQTVRLIQNGAGTVTWTASSNQPWLMVTPAAGSGPAALSLAVKFDTSLPTFGTVTGGITFAVTGANAISPITVTLTILSSTAAGSSPFGLFETPVGDATVLAGSIAVSGWALDNVGVARVELWRDLQPGETTPPFVSTPGDPRHGKVFLSNATFVDGARPDVEARYPTTPFNYRAGWGYLLFTWGLWNQGNGTYTLHAFAFDQESNVSTLGSKTIVVNNSAAAKPFGTIDTPAIGGEASGPNFGWALTPPTGGLATCKIQPSGVQVSIDSGPLQPVVYGGDVRSDIAGAFPGFSNSAAAGGHYLFDWSTLRNGVHTIGWLITDDCNRAAGVGSRFFNVSTGTNLTAADTPIAVAGPPSLASAAQPTEPESNDPIAVARGYGELPAIVTPGEAGSRTVELTQGERIEIRVPHGFAVAYQLVTDGQRRALPTGSTWDAASGTFQWQPAAGFLGRYRIVFSNGSERISVRVVIVP